MPDSHAIIAQLIEGLDPGALVTQFVVIAEVIGTEGERAMWIDTHDGATRWDTYGLLEYAMNQERAGQYAREDEP
jgi:hypothetical protein